MIHYFVMGYAIAWFQKISIPPLTEEIGTSWGMGGSMGPKN